MAEKQPSFLFVDDDANSREVLQVIINRIMGYPQLFQFEDSQDFMSRLRALPTIPDVIFLDILIQPIDGYEMLKLIRSDATYQASKVIALTASIMPSDVVMLQKVGFDGLIGKPIAHKLFPGLVQKILAGEPVWYIP
jgi:two-component system cell cycle response regulator DivK